MNRNDVLREGKFNYNFLKQLMNILSGYDECPFDIKFDTLCDTSGQILGKASKERISEKSTF